VTAPPLFSHVAARPEEASSGEQAAQPPPTRRRKIAKKHLTPAQGKPAPTLVVEQSAGENGKFGFKMPKLTGWSSQPQSGWQLPSTVQPTLTAKPQQPAKPTVSRQPKANAQGLGHGPTATLEPTKDGAQAIHSGEGNQACLFVPGSVSGKRITYLIDTGCTHNLLSKTVFDRLPASVRAQLSPLDTTAAMADGSGLPMFGKLSLPCKLRNVHFEAEFRICKLSDEAILGMTFLGGEQCTYPSPARCRCPAPRLFHPEVKRRCAAGSPHHLARQWD